MAVKKNTINKKFVPIKKLLFWVLVTTWVILTTIGANPVEEPFIAVGQTYTTIYFLLIIIL